MLCGPCNRKRTTGVGMAEMKDASRRVVEGAQALGIEIEVRDTGRSTRTAQEAADVCGCALGQIVKSLLFRGKVTGKPYLLLVSGANRVDEKGVAAVIGEALMRPDGQYVRDMTGYAIGGVPPFAHKERIATYVDRDLLAFDAVWAAAGTPESMFAVAPDALARTTGGQVIQMT